MRQNCNFVIKENKNLITNFEEKFEKKISHYKNKSEQQSSDYKQEEDFLFASTKYSELYKQINETIILLSLNNCTIIEKHILTEQLRELCRLFFVYLENSEYKNDYWKLFEWQEQETIDYEYTYIRPEDFNTEFVHNLIKPFIENYDYQIEKATEIRPKKITLDKDWLKVAYYFANGEIYNFYKNGTGLTGVTLKNKIFGENSKDNYRIYINYTLLNETGRNINKNIFKRSKAETEINTVLKYCLQEKITVCDNFYQECYKNGIDIDPL